MTICTHASCHFKIGCAGGSKRLMSKRKRNVSEQQTVLETTNKTVKVKL